ncbi:Ycf51 family protein [Anabaena sp. CCY 9910]|uniref:Ycf51 family protein n=1 Tax=Anabaena sp. CCY 9910 TaxID=3103870 RepID=UPI0039E1A816
MLTTAEFLKYTQWSGIATVVFAVLAILAFLFKWGIRFRLVGTTGFMLVLTAGLFGLSIVPLSRTVIPGAVKYTLVYDNGSNQAVISLSPKISPAEVEATLLQVASNLNSFGRSGGRNDDKVTIRARTLIHPEPGLTIPIYLGEVKRSLASREDTQISVEIYPEKFAQLPPTEA